MFKKTATILILISFCFTLSVGCNKNFKDNWDQFIQVACKNYEIFHTKISDGAEALQGILNLITAGWPESNSEVPTFILAAQLVVSGLTTVLALIAKTCPTQEDVNEAEKVVKRVQSQPVVQLAMKMAKVNLAKKKVIK